MIAEEVKSKKIKVDLERLGGINNFGAGYIDKDNGVIFGPRTDEPMKRIMDPYGGFRMVENSLKAYGLGVDLAIKEKLNEYRRTHNRGTFDAYAKEMKTSRSIGLLTGLPDAYGRGRIIGDYRRIVLYDIDCLKAMRIRDKKNLTGDTTEEIIRRREEFSEQIRAFDGIEDMAMSCGLDTSRSAMNATETVQWLYFGYLATVKRNSGAAMLIGRNTAFLDIYIKRDMKKGS